MALMGKRLPMRKLFSTNGVFNQIIIAIVLTVFALRAFVPVGFMPGQANGENTIVICSGFEEKTVHVGDDGKPAHSTAQDMPCGFAVNGHGATPDTVAIIAPIFKTLENNVFKRVDLISAQNAHAYVTRAPPSLV